GVQEPAGRARGLRRGTCVATAPGRRTVGAGGALPAPRTPTRPSALDLADPPGTSPAAVRHAYASAGAPPAPPALAPTPRRSRATGAPPLAAGSLATPAPPRTRS